MRNCRILPYCRFSLGFVLAATKQKMQTWEVELGAMPQTPGLEMEWGGGGIGGQGLSQQTSHSLLFP